MEDDDVDIEDKPAEENARSKKRQAVPRASGARTRKHGTGRRQVAV
jgi:hypothetical protein